jgi:hypothetical protein
LASVAAELDYSQQHIPLSAGGGGVPRGDSGSDTAILSSPSPLQQSRPVSSVGGGGGGGWGMMSAASLRFGMSSAEEQAPTLGAGLVCDSAVGHDEEDIVVEI